MEGGVHFERLSDHRYRAISCGAVIGYVQRCSSHHWHAGLPGERRWCDEPGFDRHPGHRTRCEAVGELLAVFHAEGRAA